MSRKALIHSLFAIVLASSALARAAMPWVYSDNTRYMAIGDSITAGYGAVPQTDGYAYVLYRGGAYDAMTNTTFADSAVPGATSAQVLQYQVPQAVAFQPHVITMTVGGNDLFTILDSGANPLEVLGAFSGNLAGILGTMCTALPDTKIYVANLYLIRNFTVSLDEIIGAFNLVVDGVAGAVNAGPCAERVVVVDLYSAFLRSQQGAILFNRPDAALDQAHPSNAGHRLIAQAFLNAR